MKRVVVLTLTLIAILTLFAACSATPPPEAKMPPAAPSCTSEDLTQGKNGVTTLRDNRQAEFDRLDLAEKEAIANIEASFAKKKEALEAVQKKENEVLTGLENHKKKLSDELTDVQAKRPANDKPADLAIFNSNIMELENALAENKIAENESQTKIKQHGDELAALPEQKKAAIEATKLVTNGGKTAYDQSIITAEGKYQNLLACRRRAIEKVLDGQK